MLLEVRELTAGYRWKRVVFSACLEVGEEELAYIYGPSSSGKSTLLKGIVGRARIFSGTRVFDGRDLSKVKIGEMSKIGLIYIPQKGGFFGSLTVKEHFKLVSETPSLPRNVLSLMDKLGFPFKELENVKAEKLRLEDKRILSLIIALALNPKLLMIDEPFEGLNDFTTIREAIKLIKNDLHTSQIVASRFPPQKVGLTPDKLFFMKSGFLTPSRFSSSSL